MTKQGLFFLAALIGSLLIKLTVSTSVSAYPTGAPAGYTGSPGDGQHCVSCHGGSATAVTNWITSDIPSQGYTAGTVYNITVTVTGTGKKGFEVSPQDATGVQLGTLAAGTGNHLVGGTKYVTHTSAGSSSANKIWNFTWTAPVPGTGTVTFYGAMVVAKPNIKLCTLVANEYVAAPLTATASATPSLICAVQSSQLNVNPSGGSGTYTYSWNSMPPGYTSTLQNPVVTPAVTTHYMVQVSDGSLFTDASTDVNVNQAAADNAGNDTTCDYIVAQVPLYGAASNFSSHLWTTSGSGTFSDANALSGYYYPSTDDKNLGSVTLTLTASALSPCTTPASDSRVIHINGPIGIAENPGTQVRMVISPNPSHGLFTLRISGIDNKDLTITISDITGRTIAHRALNGSASQQEQFDLSGSPKGLYLVKIQTSGESIIRKLVIE